MDNKNNNNNNRKSERTDFADEINSESDRKSKNNNR